KALVFWELEPGEPFKEINFDGYDLEMGITLPTAGDTNNWAVDDFLIFGFKKGILALGDIGLDTGNLNDLAVLVSVVRGHNPSDEFGHFRPHDQ
ncbi:MAG: hypothetical protein JSW50_00675, partial [Candidatus Latescibacterota bacterium]